VAFTRAFRNITFYSYLRLPRGR